ncbi:uncharacterized protein LOC108595512 [Drosophila busckii]|uniref:uncharacterized protein LOC108595512 n=1 Tax=Drosophila busckii TaxID=30019 RepID=UPI00083F1F1C|nr:uncharacterized protein LOC108595512 [Drosophila busckii]
MDIDLNDVAVTPDFDIRSTLGLDNERLDCEHLEDLTERWIDPHRPSFITVLMRFFGNIFVDCFLAVFS